MELIITESIQIQSLDHKSLRLNLKVRQREKPVCRRCPGLAPTPLHLQVQMPIVRSTAPSLCRCPFGAFLRMTNSTGLTWQRVRQAKRLNRGGRTLCTEVKRTSPGAKLPAPRKLAGQKVQKDSALKASNLLKGELSHSPLQMGFESF